MSTPSAFNSKILYYVDYNGAVWRDVESGPCPRLIRMIKSLWRDYNIFHVEAALKRALPSLEKAYVSSIVAKKCGITNDQYRSLVSMSKLFSTGNTDQKVDFANFLKDIRGNKKFNKNIKTLMNKTKSLSTISHKVLEEVSAFSHKTSMEAELVRVAAKADAVLDSYLTDSVIFTEDMLTLKDVKTLESSSKMKPFLDQIAQYQDLKDSSIYEIYKAVTNTSKFIDTTLSLAEKQDPSKPGTFIVHDQETMSAFRNSPIPSFVIFIFKNIFKTNIGHISVGFKDENGQDLEAHMWGPSVGKFALSRRSLGNRCFKTIRLHSHLLVDERKMKMLYGDNWEKLLDTKYEAISRSYFKTNPELKKLYNPRLKQILAGIGYRFSFSKQSWEERCEFPKNNRVICSEFAILSSLQCLKKLNEEIKNDWELLDSTEEAPKVNPPVRENRRLNRVIPHEIVSKAINDGLATEMPQAHCIRQMIRCNEKGLMF